MTSIRVFVSSTFRDMHDEREELAKRVFPRLRRLCAERGVSFDDVDLRWGVTEAQAERGEVAPICFAEIDRCRPYFLGILGGRYGTVPPRETLLALTSRYPWLSEHLDESMTELEFRYGALESGSPPRRAFFYLRDVAPEPRAHALRQEVIASGHPVLDGYRDAAEIGARVLADLTALVDSLYPANADPLDREAAEHEVFAQNRIAGYLARTDDLQRLDAFAELQGADGPGLVVLGETGVGKSALLASFVAQHRPAHPEDVLLYHAAGANAWSADGAALLTRILREFNRRLGLELPVPDGARALQAAFVTALGRIDRKVVLVIDALDEIEDRDAFPDLFWLPRTLPANLRLIVSTLPGRWLDTLEKHGWPTLTVRPLTVDERRQIIARVLREAGKVLDERHVVRLAEALPTANALFLRRVLEELRVFGVRKRLEEMLERYLAPRETDRTPPTLHDLFARILARYEEDYERERPRLVGDAMALVWASRRGLEESDLLALLGGGDDDPFPQAYWAPLYCAAEHSLIDRAGRITIAHHAMREAVHQRYLSTAQAQRAVHARLADHFEKREAGPRKVEELPWQLARAGEYRRLSRVLADLPFLEQAWKASRADVESYWGEIYAKAPFVVAAHAYGPVMADPVAHVEYLDPVQLLLGFLGQRADIRHMDERLVEHYRTTGDERNLARFLHDLAAELRKIGELDRAMALLHEEGAIWRKLGEEKMTAAVLDAQGMVLRRQAQFDRALALHEEAEAIARRLGKSALLGGILNNKAWVLREQGLFDDLPPLFREVESIARRNSDPWSLAHALAILADLAYEPLFRKRAYSDDDYEYFLREIHPLTEEAWQLARAGYMDIADELQTKFEEGRNFIRQYGSRLTNRGVRHYEQEELDAARDCFEAALKVYRRVDDETGIGICMGELGLVHAAHGEHEPALELLREEEVLCRRQNDLHGLHYCLSNQTLVHLERDDLAAAQKTLQTLERECASVEDDDPSAERRRLAHTATLLHRQGKPLEALEIVFRQQRLSERAGDSEGLVRALLQGANLLAETGQFTAAAMSAERASHFAKQHGFVTLQRQADDTLATVLPLAFRGGCGSWLRKLFGR